MGRKVLLFAMNGFMHEKDQGEEEHKKDTQDPEGFQKTEQRSLLLKPSIEEGLSFLSGRGPIGAPLVEKGLAAVPAFAD